MFPCSSEEKTQVLRFSLKRFVNEERSFYRLIFWAKKNCQDLQTLTFVALFSDISGAKSRELCAVLEKRSMSLGKKRAVLMDYLNCKDFFFFFFSEGEVESFGMSTVHMVSSPEWLDVLSREDPGSEPWLCCQHAVDFGQAPSDAAGPCFAKWDKTLLPVCAQWESRKATHFSCLNLVDFFLKQANV